MTCLKEKMTVTSGRQLELITEGFAALFKALMSQILLVHIDNYSTIILFLQFSAPLLVALRQDLHCIWFPALSRSDPG